MEPGTDEQSVVLEEEVDENYVPTDDEIKEYAVWLGMDLENEKDLLWIASEGLKAPLPEDWKPCRSPEGDIYYFNFSTGESVWDHPCDEYYRKLYQDEKKKKRSSTTGLAGAGSSAGAPKPVVASNVTFQAPQKLSSLDSVPGLRRKEDPFKKAGSLLGQSPPKEQKASRQASEAEEAEARALESTRDAEFRKTFAEELGKERSAWEASQREELERKKKELLKAGEAELEALRKEAEEAQAREKAASNAKLDRYREDLADLHRKEEGVLRKLQDQKTADLEREIEQERTARLENLERRAKEAASEAEAEHERKAAELRGKNESALKQLEIDLQLVSETCAQKMETLVKEKEEKEREFAEEMAAMEADHAARLEARKAELETELKTKIEEVAASNELAVKNKEMVQSTFAEEQQRMEETVKQKVKEEREKIQSFLEAETAKLSSEREDKLAAARERHDAQLKEELEKMEASMQLRIKEAKESNEAFLEDELQALRSTRAETLAEDRMQQEDQVNEALSRHQKELKEAEREAEERLQEKFKELEERHVKEIEKKEQELQMESKLRVERVRMNLEGYESTCREEVDAEKASIMDRLKREMAAQVEEEKETCVEKLAQEMEEFKTQERLKFMARAETELQEETRQAEDGDTVSQHEGSTESETSQTSDVAEAVKPAAHRSPAPILSPSDKAHRESHDLLLVFLKEQKHFLQKRQSALHKAREDWKVHVRTLKERKESGLPSSSSDEVALATAKYTLEAQSRMLNEDTRNYRQLKQEIEKTIRKANSGKENELFATLDHEFTPLSRPGSGAKASLKDEGYESLQHARKFVKTMSSARRSYEKNTHDRQHEDALHVLSGHSKWLSSFKSKLSTLSTKTNHNIALNRLRNSNRELVIRIQR